jgi:hypothetical protein
MKRRISAGGYRRGLKLRRAIMSKIENNKVIGPTIVIASF